MATCKVCFRHCKLEEGQIGFCGGRICRDGQVVAGNYGLVTALALDPIEKKPLQRGSTLQRSSCVKGSLIMLFPGIRSRISAE